MEQLALLKGKLVATAVPLGPPDGVWLYPGLIDRSDQEALRDAVSEVLAAAPAYRPTMPRTGHPLSVRMTNCGPLGWISDRRGYRYEPRHPETGRPWPPMPAALLEIWDAVSGCAAPPEACLVNLYTSEARMGPHRDFDEQEVRAPVVSISLGAAALFRLGGVSRGASTRSVRLASGDVVVLGGAGRLAYHGIDRVLPGTSTLLDPGPTSDGASPVARINLTLRRVTPL